MTTRRDTALDRLDGQRSARRQPGGEDGDGDQEQGQHSKRRKRPFG